MTHKRWLKALPTSSQMTRPTGLLCKTFACRRNVSYDMMSTGLGMRRPRCVIKWSVKQPVTFCDEHEHQKHQWQSSIAGRYGMSMKAHILRFLSISAFDPESIARAATRPESHLLISFSQFYKLTFLLVNTMYWQYNTMYCSYGYMSCIHNFWCTIM